MKTRYLKICLVVGLLLGLFASYSSFALATGVSGRVFDSVTGDVISGAVVTLIAFDGGAITPTPPADTAGTNPQTVSFNGFSWLTETGKEYLLTVSAAGYKFPTAQTAWQLDWTTRGFTDTSSADAFRGWRWTQPAGGVTVDIPLDPPFIYLRANTTGQETFGPSQSKTINHNIYWDDDVLQPRDYFIMGYVRIEFDPAVIDVSQITSQGNLFSASIVERGVGYIVTSHWYFFWGEPPVNDPNQVAYQITFKSTPVGGTTNLRYSIVGNRFRAGRAMNIRPVPVRIRLFPQAPSNLQAWPNSSSEILLSWQDNSDNEEGFIVERKEGLNGTYAEYMFVSPTTIPSAPSMVYIPDSDLPADTTYYYRVKAYNDAGNSAYSNEANATTLLETPTALTATAISISQINLSWTDNSQTEDGFVIERWGSEPGEAPGFKPIATVGQNITSFSDNTLSPVTHYEYTVKAYRQTNSSYSSESAGAVTQPLNIAYLTDLVTQYYQQGQITNYGVYQSLLAKLSAAQASADAGNSTAYRNQLDALINQLSAQSGKQITASAAVPLTQLTQSSQQIGVKIEHLATKGRMDEPVPHSPIDYIPTGFTMTYQATFTTTAVSGNYTWVISPSDTSVVTLTGLLSGPISPETKAPTIQVYVPSTDTIELTFVYTPTHSEPISPTRSAQGVSTTFIPSGTNAVTGEQRTYISPTNITGVQAPFTMTAGAIISPTNDTTISDWQLGYLKNMITWTAIAYYHPISKFAHSIPQNKLPLLDHLGPGIPATHTLVAYQPHNFSPDQKRISVTHFDAPTTEWLRQRNNATLQKVKHHVELAVWLIARNMKTGVIEYIRWWKVTIDYTVDFDLETGVGVVREDKSAVEPSKAGGLGMGTWPDPKIPTLTSPPLANDVLKETSVIPDP